MADTIPAPIALFAYNRLWHTRKTIEALLNNELADESTLFIFSDGPRSPSDYSRVQEVRTYLKKVQGFREVTLIERTQNLGLAESIIRGVTQIVMQYGRIIVLEDDMVTSPYFLRYMNEALEFYKDEDRVVSIHGYLYPLHVPLPETFFLQGADCWGWATWKRGWDIFEPDGRRMLKELKTRKLVRRFDCNGTHPYTRMLRWQARGMIDSWAIRWHASAFLKEKLTLYPAESLLANIGLDSSGTHCSTTTTFDVSIAERPVPVASIPIEEHAAAAAALQCYYRKTRSSLAKRALQELKCLITGR